MAEDSAWLGTLAIVAGIVAALVVLGVGVVALLGRGRGRPPGVRDVLLVTAGAVALVALGALVTALLPRSGQDVVFQTPLLIIVLIGGTGLVLWRILRHPGSGAGPGA